MMIESTEDEYLLVWDSEEDSAEVYTPDEARQLDEERYRAEFVFPDRALAEEYADAYEPENGSSA